MINLALSLLAGVAAFALFRLTFVHAAWEALLPGLLAAGGAYFLLARRTMRQLEAVMGAAQKELMGTAPGSKKDRDARLDRAEKVVERGFALSRWQFLVASNVHAQLGVFRYWKEDYDGAEPHLEKAYVGHWIARCMLGALAYRKKDKARMEKVFEGAVGSSPKEGLLWSTYAWCEEKLGDRDAAIAALVRGAEKVPADERLKANLERLRNGKKPRMDSYAEQWWQLALESPPMQQPNPFAGGRRAGYRR